MKLKIWLFCSLLMAGTVNLSNAQINVTTAPTPEQLVEYLLTPGVTAFNVSTVGLPVQRGYLTGGTGTQLGFEGGVILSSGSATEIGGAGQVGGVFGNADLLTVAQSVPPMIGQNFTVSSVHDVCILEFDFIPTGDSISFRYVFGSDEYLTYVNTGFNDVFAFFLAGPGITGPFSAPAGFPGGSINIATVPNSNPPLPITISSVNNVLNSQYYINQPQGVPINGITTVLTARAAVICGEVYHIKLAIADGSDDFLTSAVILEEGSFESSGYSVTFNTTLNDNGTPIVYEGCEPVTLTLTKGGCNTSDVDTLFLSVGGTATPGIDYEALPEFVVFEPGSNTITIELNVFADLEIEGIETIIITIEFLDNQGELTTAEATLLIYDYIPMSLTLSDFTVPCPGDPVTIPSGLTGGAPPFTYEWNTGATTPSITETVLETTTYSVVVTDYCGFTVEASSVATLIEWPPFIVAGQTFTACPGAPVAITPSVSGGSNALGYTYNWGFGSDESNPIVTVEETTSFNVQVSDQCETLPTTVIVEVIEFIPFQVQFPIEVCGGSTGQYAIQGENPVITSIFSEPDGFSFFNDQFSAPTTGGQPSMSYTIVAVDNCGNTSTAPVLVVGCETTVPNIFSPNNDGINDYFMVDGLVNFANSKMKVFNRWGQLVYENDDYGRKNGEFCEDPSSWKDCWWNGEDLSDGVYFYIFSRSDGYEESGYVHMVRK